jgi:hypothetical protein
MSKQRHNVLLGADREKSCLQHPKILKHRLLVISAQITIEKLSLLTDQTMDLIKNGYFE